MTIKELKTIIRKLDKNTVVKVNGKDVMVYVRLWTSNKLMQIFKQF